MTEPDLEKAEKLGLSLLSYKDAIAMQPSEEVDTRELQQILNHRSQNSLAAEQELIMAWRLYTQLREIQIAGGEFNHCSTPEEIQAAHRYSTSRNIIFDRLCVRGIEWIETTIRTTIQHDILSDRGRWKAVRTKDDNRRNEFATLWNPSQPEVNDTNECAQSRRRFVESSVEWCRSKEETNKIRYTFNSLAAELRIMLEEHRDYWAQHPEEPYDDSGLNHAFSFVFHGPNHGLGELFHAWEQYLETRALVLELSSQEPFLRCTDEEKASTKEQRRKCPIKYPHSHPKARDIIESHIRSIIREDIVADTEKWKRHRESLEDAKRRYQAHHTHQLQIYKEEFIAKGSAD